jgi:hypothetical protein
MRFKSFRRKPVVKLMITYGNRNNASALPGKKGGRLKIRSSRFDDNQSIDKGKIIVSRQLKLVLLFEKRALIVFMSWFLK